MTSLSSIYDSDRSERLVERLLRVARPAELDQLGALGRELLRLGRGGVAGEDADAREGGAEVGQERVADVLACACASRRLALGHHCVSVLCAHRGSRFRRGSLR